MQAWLVLEDGSIWAGEARGAFRETTCEVVFNTSMTGYLEVLTDPSYAGQGIVMTYPMIGNYGVEPEDFESGRLQPSCFIVRELCDHPSNFRCAGTLEDLLRTQGIPCLSGVDTRALVKKLREGGTMRGVLTDDVSDLEKQIAKARDYALADVVESVSVIEKIERGVQNAGASIALLDCGTKNNIARSLLERGCRVTQYPCSATAAEILAAEHDAVMLSNGPGDPTDCKGAIAAVREIYHSDIPTFAICLGHQLSALALGGSTCRMKYGHRGANHPVKFLAEDRTYLSSQNHGYMVQAEGLPANAEVHCINVNDGTVEGVCYHGKPYFTVQFHPEASPGPKDTAFLFDVFLKMAETGKNPWD
ncbi:MAG: carbamoyl phosphate synthase small subunit [Oscillospiraceae bacterium]|jgi:carbamoyl-phosphate synthase small subunit|nr:carbamoyl phosphate synthase small subunit [Oscillospiraceae bacterium]